MTLIIPQNLVDCTAEVSARYNVSVWKQPPSHQFAMKRELIWTMLQFPKQLFKEIQEDRKLWRAAKIGCFNNQGQEALSSL
jgi:hypothetical protein